MSDIHAAPEAAALPSPMSGGRVLEIRFTGSGSEYFRIWAVNLLLILVTLGLYLPFAKARRIRYFYANTLVDGQALSFHGDAWKMFRGFLLLVVLMGAYTFAGKVSATAALVAFLILCGVWPALWRASLQFRLGNTSWRGLRMRFDGKLKDAYLACAPLYLPLMAFMVWARLMEPATDTDRAAMEAYGLTSLLVMGVVMLLSPLSFAMFKRYQHNGYRIAAQQAHIELSNGRVYLLGLKLLGVSIASTLLAGLLVGVLAVAVFAVSGFKPNTASPLSQVGFFAIGLLVYLLVFAVVLPFGAARMQNLAWNGTRSQALAFRSDLRFKALFGLTLTNWLLTALTLSLYRPFAAVATARLRLEAVQIDSQEDPADWVAASLAGHADATGDIAGDFFGIDMGL
ncbi:YjgN family protein [Roseateles sp. LYH14W]|uniref:YjgN family protein n=1 Tax=Pelomonas parva TaxID=3299032 RepID=A0ABW7F027_9BURK